MRAKTLSSKPIKKQTLAEQMAATIQESILSGDLESGASLPTEPELAEQFGVSRAVVRDATRILMAQGLVSVQHGRGVFVTESQTEAFGQALLLALRRAGATVWDVEQFGQILLPEIAALASESATDEEVAALWQSTEKYLAEFQEYQATSLDGEPAARETERILRAYRTLLQAVFDATHNQLIRQLAPPLIHLRTLRRWTGGSDDRAEAAAAVRSERTFLRNLMEAISGRDPDRARATAARLSQLPPEAIKVMRQTPIGETPVIPISLAQLEAHYQAVIGEEV